MKTLREASIGDTVKVVKLHGEGPIKRRIMDMGITKGVEIYVRKVAPLGDPMEVTVRGYELSLRKADTTPQSRRSRDSSPCTGEPRFALQTLGENPTQGAEVPQKTVYILSNF